MKLLPHETLDEFLDREDRQVLHLRDMGLSVRLARAMVENDLETPEQVRAALLAGWFKKKRNFGLKTYKEACQWAGLTPKGKEVALCPHCGGQL